MIKLITVGEYTPKKVNLEEKIRLLTGAGYWTSTALPAAGIPSIRFSDGPAGLRPQGKNGDNLGEGKSFPATCFPSHSALACSWNRRLIEGVGQRAGSEANAFGVDVLLAPDINLKRNPLCGRNFEYFSEDPYFNGKAGAAYASGVKSSGAGACLKHYAANNREFARMVCNSVADERTLRELYLTGFEIAVKESAPAAVMTAYNKVNGVYCNEHAELIDKILRGEWGFDGIVISDWGGTHDRAAAAKAGADIEMPPCRLSEHEIKRALRECAVTESHIDGCFERIRSGSRKLERRRGECDFAEHSAYAKKCADECAVLLKNDGVLPLGGNEKVALIGGMAKSTPIQGGGSSRVNPKSALNFYDCVKDGITGYERGYGGKKHLKRALKLCARADTAVICAGLTSGDMEGADRKSLCLPEEQVELIEKISALGKKVIVVLFCGSVVDCGWDKNINALLYAGLSGQNAAQSVADILYGRVNPSGKLTETFPLSYGDIPYGGDFGNDPYREIYREGMAVGYRYFYDKKVKYPFGYGLSYTDFAYDGLTVGEEGASFYITNTGKARGGETAQMYIRFPDGANCGFLQLKGFEKVFLDPGERKKVFIPFDGYSFRSYDTQSASWVTVGGEYKIYIASSSVDLRLSGSIFKDGVEGAAPCVPPVDGEGYYPVEKNARGRVIANLHTPFCELRNGAGFVARLTARLAFRIMRKNPTAYGSLEYLPLRTLAQYGKFGKNRTDGFLMLCNGRFFKGLIRFFKKDKNI